MKSVRIVNSVRNTYGDEPELLPTEDSFFLVTEIQVMEKINKKWQDSNPKIMVRNYYHDFWSHLLKFKSLEGNKYFEVKDLGVQHHRITHSWKAGVQYYEDRGDVVSQPYQAGSCVMADATLPTYEIIINWDLIFSEIESQARESREKIKREEEKRKENLAKSKPLREVFLNVMFEAAKDKVFSQFPNATVGEKKHENGLGIFIPDWEVDEKKRICLLKMGGGCLAIPNDSSPRGASE